jgi:DNA-binding beta-propeller fold protein YncE
LVRIIGFGSKIGVDGNLTVVAGCTSFLSTCSDGLGDGGPATAAMLSDPYGVALDAAGNLYITDTYKNRIRKVSPDGIITAVAGRGPSYGYYYHGGYSGDGGAATDAELNLPHGVAVDPAGNIYIADTQNYVVRKVTPDGIISSVAGNGSWCCSAAIGVALQQAVTAMKTAGGTDSVNFWQWAWYWQYLPTFSGVPAGFGVAGSISPDLMERIITAGGGDALRNISAEQWVVYFRQVAPQ